MANRKKTKDEKIKSNLNLVYIYAGQLIMADKKDEERYISLLSSRLSKLVELESKTRDCKCILSGCENTEEVEFHHPAYSSPLMTVELCRGHHKIRHGKNYNFCLLEDREYLSDKYPTIESHSEFIKECLKTNNNIPEDED